MKRIYTSVILFAVMILIGLGGCGENTKQFKVPENAITLDATIAQAFEDAKAIITVVSDDGYFTSGINLNVIFKKHGIKIIKIFFDRIRNLGCRRCTVRRKRNTSERYDRFRHYRL